MTFVKVGFRVKGLGFRVAADDLPVHTLFDDHLLQQLFQKIYPEKPDNLIQICPYPLAVYVTTEPAKGHGPIHDLMGPRGAGARDGAMRGPMNQ